MPINRPIVAFLRKCLALISLSFFVFCMNTRTIAADLDLLDDIPLLSDLTDLLEPLLEDTFVDTTFGTVVKRLSDAVNTQDNADPSNGSVQFIAQEYSTISPFNSNNSLLLLLHFSYFALYTGDGKYIRDLPFEVHASSEPRWSRHDPGVFYFISNNQLKLFDIKDWGSTVIREFSEYSRISGLGESDLSYDGDHFVLIGDDREIFVYTVSSNTKGGVLEADVVRNVDNVQITPDNNVIVGWYDHGSGLRKGYELYDRNMVLKQQLTTVLGHMDVTRDEDGREIMLWHNAAEPTPLAGCENAVVKVDLGTGNRTCVVRFPWGLGVHIAAAESANWFFASTYTSDISFPSNELQVVRVDLAGTRIQRLVQHGSEPFDNYRFQPKAATSRDGTHVVYASNYGLQESRDFPAGYTDAYLITDLSTSPIRAIELPDPDPIEEDDPPAGGAGDDSGEESGSGDTGTVGSGGTDSVQGGTSGSGVGGIVSRPPEPVVQDCNAMFRNLGDEQIRLAEESDSNATYRGKWRTFSHKKLSGSQIMASNEAGATVEFDFLGTAVGWVGYIGPWGATANVYIDNMFVTEIDTGYRSHRIIERIFVVKNLQPGFHTLSVEVADQDGLDSSGIWIDAFETIDSAASLYNCYHDTTPTGLISNYLSSPE